MPYSAEISRSNPTAFLFLVDQSASMSDRIQGGDTKAKFTADALNRILLSLVDMCQKAEGVRHYFDVGVIGYGGSTARNALKGNFSSTVFNPITAFEKYPLRIEERYRKLPDGAGGIVEMQEKFPVWYEAEFNGATPMCEAMKMAAVELANWCDRHPNSYPPTLLHITDGESTDGDPEPIADAVKQISTNDGSVISCNLHVTSDGAGSIKYPNSEHALNNPFSKLLFRMSSVMPDKAARIAQQKQYVVTSESRFFVFNADVVDLVQFLEIGTRSAVALLSNDR